MIGHLQSNKVKFIAPFVSLIHSVDSAKLLGEIERQAKKNNRIIPCLLQVHIADEETKFGWDAAELQDAFDHHTFDEFQSVQITGLMGIASLTQDRNQIREEFRGLRKLFDLLRIRPLPATVVMNELSMGMSSDYAIALEEGSTLVRIGSSIFGDRKL
jgi:pyridoxal phosphate enzyme (YggS family)